MSTNHVPQTVSPSTVRAYSTKEALSFMDLFFSRLAAPAMPVVEVAEEQPAQPFAMESSPAPRRSVRSAFRLREELIAVLWDEILSDEAEALRKPFDDALAEVTHQAGLSFQHYETLEWSASVAIADIARAAFVAGLQFGRDPLSLVLQPAE